MLGTVVWGEKAARKASFRIGLFAACVFSVTPFTSLMGSQAGLLWGFDGGSHHAILIGVEQYEHARPLRFIRNDVSALAGTLRERGDYNDVSKFIDSEPDSEEHPTRSNLLERVPKHLDRVRRGDHLLVYFSGHGFVDDRGELYLAPIDCVPRRAAETGVSVKWLREQLENSRAKSVVLVIDACHAGNVLGPTRSGMPSANRGITGEDLKKNLERATGIYTIASCHERETSVLWEEKQKSLFTYWLNQGLMGAADADGDGRITADELYRFVHRHVLLTARRLNHTQTPVQIVGQDIAGVPTVIELQAEPVMQTFDRMTELVHEQVLHHGIKRLGVVEFTCRLGDQEFLSGPIGPFGRLAAERFQQGLVQRGELAEVPYRVIDNRQVRTAMKAVRVEGRPAGDIHQLHDRQTIQRELSSRLSDVSALLVGRFCLIYDQHQLRLTCELIELESADILATVTGVIHFDGELLGFLGFSAEIPPPPALELDPSRYVLEQFDEARNRDHPLLRDDFPYPVRIMSGTREKPFYVLPGQPGNVFVSAREGESFWIRAQNKTEDRVAVVVLADGVNVRLPESQEAVAVQAAFESAQHVLPNEARGWVLESQGSYGFRGFYSGQEDRSLVRPFRFVSPPQGVAARFGLGEDVGQISLFVFAEACHSEDARLELERGPAIGKDAAEATVLRRAHGFRRGDLLTAVSIRYVQEDSLAEEHRHAN